MTSLKEVILSEVERLADDPSEVDDSSVDYLVELLSQEDGVERADVQALLSGIVEQQVSDEDFDTFWTKVSGDACSLLEDEPKEASIPKELTEEQKAKLNMLEESHPKDNPEVDSDDKNQHTSTSSTKKKKSKSETDGPKKSRSERNREERDKRTAEMAKLKAAKDGEFQTKRFERFHKTWMGKGQWKRQDYSIAEKIEELEDDDYSSAWLECLRLGIPWGGRGAGGRGIQRVTGESLDVLVQNVTMAKDGRVLLTNATLKLNHGTRYCLTGRNGCGKTTLLKRIAMGTLPGFPPWLRVQYVEQELKGSDLTPVEYVLGFDFERTRLLAEEEEILEILETGKAQVSEEDESLVELSAEEILQRQTRLSEIYERLEQIDAYNAESRAEEKLRSVGFTDELLSKTTEELSGGWRMRCALCGTLFMKPDILLLDEPTNALDVLGVEWLRRYIGNKENFDGTVLLVSHDRAFINSVTEELIVLRNKQFAYFPGTYDEYRVMLKQRREGLQNKVSLQEKKKDELKAYIETQQRASRDRKSKGGDPKKQKQIRSKKKQIEKIDRMGLGRADGKYFKQSKDGWYGIPSALDFDEKPLHFKFPECSASCSKDSVLMQLDAVSYGWNPEAPLVSSFSAQVSGCDRIGIIGPNGTGKTTLLKLLIEEIKPLTGSITTSLSERDIAVFHQDMIARLDHEKTPAQVILELPRGPGTVDCQTLEQARVYLGSFGLTGDLSMRPIGTLSGGEKSRVVFAVESYKKASLLILDEPTAHLDLDSIDVLASAMNQFNGTVLVISHDSAFLAETCSKLWVFDPKTKAILVSMPQAEQEPKEFVLSRFSEFIARNFDLSK